MVHILLRSFEVSRYGTSDRNNESFLTNSASAFNQRTVRTRRWNKSLLLVATMACCSLFLAGCGASFVVKGASGSSGSGGSSSTSSGTIAASPDSVDFGTVNVGQSANTKVVLTNKGTEPVQVSQLSVSGQNFSVDGQGDLPVTLAAGSTLSFKVHYQPQSDVTSTGEVTATTDSTITPTASIKLHGIGKKAAAAVSNGSLSCTNATMTGSGFDLCTVTLATADAFDVTNVSLSSSNVAVTLPATVTVPAGSISANFSASVSTVSSAQTATLTATINGASSTFSLQLDPYTPTLSMSATSIAFGNEAINATATKSVTLTSSGSAPVTISSASVSGTGFSISGLALPMTLNPGKTATVDVHFDPTTSGSHSGQLSIASDSSSSPSSVIALSGTGTNSSSSPLSGITCSKGSIMGSGTDACTVTLSTAAGSGGTSVSLSSSDSAVSVPASLTVPASATSAAFTATVSAVTSTQTATLEASSGGVTKDFALQLNATTPTLSVNTTTVSFGDVTVGQTGTQSLTLSSTGNGPVTISAISVAGSLFSASGLTAPVTLNPGQSATLTLHMVAQTVSNYTGTLTIYSNSSTGNINVSMNGSGTSAPGNLSALTCNNGSMSGAGTVACTVSLSAAAGSSGLSVNLASNNSAVAVPSSVAVPANATSASFNATVSSFSTQQTVTLTASSGGVTKSFIIQLTTGTATLGINATSISFGSTVIGTPVTQSVTFSSTGTAAVTINSTTLSGSGFSTSGVNFPVTLNPGQTATLSVQFDPTSAGAASGQLTITSTASTNPVSVISLSGTGNPHEVDLSWSAPTGGNDPVAGYIVYRSANGGTTYQQVGTTSASQTTYMDNTVASSQAYDYVVKSYDSSGNQSAASNMTSVTIP